MVTSGRADVFALAGIWLNWMADNNPDAGVEVTESFVQGPDHRRRPTGRDLHPPAA